MAWSDQHAARELLVLRHAKSAWDTGAPTDYERPLAKRGRRDCPRIGAWLRSQNLAPDLIVSSPAERARQTAQRVAEAIGIDTEAIEWDERIYMAGLGSLLDVLAMCPDGLERIMIVGHNPGLEELVMYLTAGPLDVPSNGKIMPTCAVAHFHMPPSWTELDEGCADLMTITRPRTLED